MNIIITWTEGSKYPRFDVSLSTRPDSEPFIKIRGCGIMKKKADGTEFVSWPSTKNESTGKYWNHVYGSDAFNAAVLAEAKKTEPKPMPEAVKQAAAPDHTGLDDDIPW